MNIQLVVKSDVFKEHYYAIQEIGRVLRECSRQYTEIRLNNEYENAQSWMRKHTKNIQPFNKENNYQIIFLTKEDEEHFKDHKHIKYLEEIATALRKIQKEKEAAYNSKEWQSAYFYFAKLKERGTVAELPSKRNGFRVQMIDSSVEKMVELAISEKSLNKSDGCHHKIDRQEVKN